MWGMLPTAAGSMWRSGRIMLALSLPLLIVALWPFLRSRPLPDRPLIKDGIQLCDVTAQTGINWRHTDGSSGRRYIVETVTAGLATFDYDGDLWIDVYFLNGAPLPGTPLVEPPPRNALFRNRGDFSFAEVTDLAGVGDTGFGLGVAVGDYNADGFADLYVNNFGPNVLYRNNGDGTFTDVTAQAGVAAGDRVGAGAAFLDIDADSHLDLYVANYVKVDFDKHPVRTAEGYPIYPGPMDFLPESDILFRNNGDGTFTDISSSSGIGNVAGTGMGMICADIDLDGDTDIFVLNDVAGNFVFVNDGHGQFEEQGLWLGGAYSREGRALGSMGIDCGDFDNDGWPDFYATSYAREWAVLFRNLGSGRMEDVTAATGAGAGTFPHVTWGVAFVDLDNDQDKDLFVACGHLQDNVELFDPTGSYKAANVVLENVGGRFRDISRQAGDGLLPRRSSRGLAADDLDNDGRVDLVVLNSREEPTVLANCSPLPGRHWVEIQLIGTKSNRDGVGSRVGIKTGTLVQWSEVHSGRGYQSHFGSRLHFGLGTNERISQIEIRWHSGHCDTFVDVPADQLLIAVESVGLFPAPLH